MNNKISGIYSWPVIILALIIFWPLGLFLIIKRTTLDKTAVMKGSSGKGLKATAIVLIVLGCLGIIGSVDPFDFSGVVVFLFFIVGGIILLNKAKKIKAEREAIKRYLNIIVNGGERQIDTIAAATGKQYEFVKEDIQKMIDKGFLKNAYVNEGARKVVLTTDNNTTANTFIETTPAVTHGQTRVVACSCCGANNTISGDVGECEYCGSPLK